MRNALPVWVLTACVAALVTGCISSHEETVFKDVERRKVEFESDAAARLFYETLSNSGPRESLGKTETDIEIPLLLHHRKKVVTGPNTIFNDAVDRCDTNRDGKITEMEARIFAQQEGKQ